MHTQRTSRWTLGLALWACVLLSAACAAKAPSADSTAAQTDTATAADVSDAQDAVDVALDTVEDAAPDSAMDITAEPEVAADVAPADVQAPPHITTFTIQAAPGATLPTGYLHLRLVNFFTPVSSPTPYDDVLFQGTVALPATVTAVVPDGTWWPVAGWFSPADNPVASNLNCDFSGVFTVTSQKPAPDQVAIVISAGKPASCTPSGPPAFLSETSSYAPPFTDTGITHLLEGLVWNGAWWIAANADGIGRVDLPAPDKAINNWLPFKKGSCQHIARLENRLFCAQRSAEIVWMEMDPATNQLVSNGVLPLPVGTHAEGLLVHQGVLYVTVHGKGVALLPLTPPGPAVLVTAPELTDAWHIAALPDGKFVIANGKDGILIAQINGSQLTVVGKVALQGLSAHLSVDGTTVAVGALAGGMHLVDATKQQAPLLLGTLPVGPWPIFGVELHKGVAYAAASRGVLAVPVPAKPVAQLAATTLTATEKHLTLDVRVAGDALVTAEYALVRRLALGAAGSQPLPIAMAVEQTWGGVVAVGEQVVYRVPVWNPGGAPLHLNGFQVTQALTKGPGGGPALPFAPLADITIVPGDTANLTVKVTKTAAGIQNADFHVHTDDPARPFLSIRLTESPLIHLGQTLPPLSYQTPQGKFVDVVAALKGKPGLLIVFAESCPVALERTAAVLTELAPFIASGELGMAAINPWDLPGAAEVGTLTVPGVQVYSPLTTKDNTQHSTVADELIPLPFQGLGPPLPLIYVLDAQGTVKYAELGYFPHALKAAVFGVLGL